MGKWNAGLGKNIFRAVSVICVFLSTVKIERGKRPMAENPGDHL